MAFALVVVATATAAAQQADPAKPTPSTTQDQGTAKAGWTPNDTDEYTINYIKQLGEKGAPLNVYNSPPVPPNSYWRWPYWDVQNTSFLWKTQIGPASYLRTKVYYNTFENGLDAFDDATYTTQSANGRFFSPTTITPTAAAPSSAPRSGKPTR